VTASTVAADSGSSSDEIDVDSCPVTPIRGLGPEGTRGRSQICPSSPLPGFESSWFDGLADLREGIYVPQNNRLYGSTAGQDYLLNIHALGFGEPHEDLDSGCFNAVFPPISVERRQIRRDPAGVVCRVAEDGEFSGWLVVEFLEPVTDESGAETSFLVSIQFRNAALGQPHYPALDEAIAVINSWPVIDPN
jgi:hypothetical protein